MNKHPMGNIDQLGAPATERQFADLNDRLSRLEAELADLKKSTAQDSGDSGAATIQPQSPKSQTQAQS